MARIQGQRQPQEDDLLQLLQLAGAARQLSQPPPMDDLLKLLGIATTLHQNEQDQALRQQAIDVQAQQNAIEQQKVSRMTPEMLAYLMSQATDPGQRQQLLRKAEPDVFSGEASVVEKPLLPQLGEKGSGSKLPKGRLAMKSQQAFMGYQPPQENVEAVLDENGNIMNFVKAGTTEPISDFVPSPESVGAFGSSKYAVGQQLTALGRYLGLLPQPQQTLPY